jgi:lipopolysaccharide export LptBFGC system permease protein LptF
LVGAIVVLVGIGMYFFGNLRIGEKPFILVSVGAVGLILGLFYPFMPRFRSGFARFFASILFAVGSFLILVSMDEAVASISIDLFFVALSVLWIFTRVSLSQWEHQRTCSQCSLVSCTVQKEKMH